MGTKQKPVIVTGASQGIGAGVLALVDGNIGESSKAASVVKTAIGKSGSIMGKAPLVDGGAHSSKW